MAIIVFQHGEGEGLGRLDAILRSNAHRLDIRRLDLPAARGGKGVPVDFDNVSGVISLGGKMHAGDDADHPWLKGEREYLKAAHERQLPVLGICLGHQLIAEALGGTVAAAAKPEWGFCRVQQVPAGNTDTILSGVPWGTYQLQMHFQEVTKLPEGATLLASSPLCKVQAFRAGLRTYGVQFHPEPTREMIEGYTRDAATLSDMKEAGITAQELLKQTAEHYETFARVNDRLVGNIVSFMFPTMSRMRA